MFHHLHVFKMSLNFIKYLSFSISKWILLLTTYVPPICLCCSRFVLALVHPLPFALGGRGYGNNNKVITTKHALSIKTHPFIKHVLKDKSLLYVMKYKWKKWKEWTYIQQQRSLFINWSVSITSTNPSLL